MTTSDNRPNPFVTVWAQDGLKFETIPESTDDRPNFEGEGKGLHKARATMQEGFPEITMKSAMRGGVPPWGQDHNKILNQITEAIRWMQAGGCASFNRALCNKIDGYPKGAILQTKGNALYLWFSTIDQNTNNPDDPDDLDNSDTTTSPDNGWVKLDFKDLEKRLKAAEDHIVVIDGRLDGHDNHLGVIDGRLDSHDTHLGVIDGRLDSHDTHLGQIDNTLSEHDGRINSNKSNILQNARNITELQESKAEKEGSCGVSFNADVMKSSKYTFCPKQQAKKALNSYVVEEIEDIAGTTVNTLFLNAGCDILDKTSGASCVALTTRDGAGRLLDVMDFGGTGTYLNCRVGFASFAGWTAFQGDVSMEGTQTTYKNQDNSCAWLTGANGRDYTLTLFPEGAPLDKDDTTKTSETFISCSGTDYSVKAKGAFMSNQYGDLAEYYQADRDDYEPGTLMCHGVDTEVTLCQSIDQSDNFFGVISTSPAYIMNGKGKDEPNSVLIALNGKVPVKVKGVVKRGDKITIGQDGYGVVSQNKNDVIVGRAKEDKVTEEVGLVSCYVQAHM